MSASPGRRAGTHFLTSSVPSPSNVGGGGDNDNDNVFDGSNVSVKPPPPLPPLPLPPLPLSVMLNIENVSKSFGNYSILKNINLQILPGNIVGLAGPSGGGKSTLLRCIQGLETAYDGKIVRSDHVGFMFQDFQLFPHMTVWKNIIYAPKLRGEYSNDSLQTLAHDLMKKLNIFDIRDRYPENLSGGQKQRVALARTLMLQPDLLLCDEPTSGLELATMGEVVDLLKSIQSEQTIMVIASHDLDFLTQIAQRILLLKNGEIVADILTKDLANPIEYFRGFY